jgi:hypothetical protein
MIRVMPVPAAEWVHQPALLRVEHYALAFFRQFIHASSNREVRCVLIAAVEHYKQRGASPESDAAT